MLFGSDNYFHLTALKFWQQKKTFASSFLKRPEKQAVSEDVVEIYSIP